MGEPFFLLGAERAGSVLIELMLSAHPAVRWGGCFDYALAWRDAEHAEWPPLIPYWEQIALSPVARAARVKIDPALPFPALVRSLLDQHAPPDRRCRGVSAHDHYGRICKLWPAARFVVLARDRRAGEAPEAEQLRRSDRGWRAIASQIDPSRRLELRYERVLADLPGELGRLCDFLDIPFDEGLLRLPQQLPRAAPEPARPAADLRPAEPGLGARFGERVARLLRG